MESITVKDKFGNDLIITPCDSTHVYVGVMGLNSKPWPYHIGQLDGDLLKAAKELIAKNK